MKASFVMCALVALNGFSALAQTTDTASTQPAGTTAATGAALPARPDLVLDPPLVTTKEGSNDQYSWTVKNIGTADSPPTKLQLTCAVIYTNDNSCCVWSGFPALTGMEILQIPPIQKWGSYAAPSLVMGHYVHLTPTGLHRLHFTAAVDPANEISELSEANNKQELTAQNFRGDPPPASIPPPTPPPLSVAPAMPAGNAELPKKITIYAEPPWKPGVPVWIMAKNTGAVALPADQVQFTCFWMDGGQVSSESCAGWFTLPAMKSIGALVPNQFVALYLLEPGIAATLIPFVNIHIDDENLQKRPYQLRFHVVGAPSQDLVLTNPK